MKNDERMQKICKIVQWITLAIGVLSIIIPILCWGSIPETIPSHYNAAGVADQYSDKGILILLFFVTAFLMGLMSIAVYCVKQEASSRYAKEAEKSQMGDVYIMLIFMNFAIQCMFAYIIFCSASVRGLGVWFLPIVLLVVLCPLLFFLIKRHRAGGKSDSETSRLIQAEQQEDGITYRSKVDWWLGLLLGGSVILTLYVTIEPIIRGKGVQGVTIIAAVIVLVTVLPLFGIKYVFYSSHLLVSCGIYGKERVEYGKIRQLKETKNPLSSAAMSLDRLQIDYLENGVHKTVLISPVRKKEFMERLEQYRKQTEV